MKLPQSIKWLCLSTSLICTVPAQADAVNLAFGLHGIAIEYYLGLSPKLNARFVLSDMPLDIDRNEDDATISVEYDRTNLGLLFDFRPMAGSFHLTTGIYVGDHNINVGAKVKDGYRYELGDREFEGQNLSVTGQIAFAKAAPYFGLGWGNATTSKGFTANFDIGVLYTGKASIDVGATGQVREYGSGGSFIDAAQDPILQSELENERIDLEDDAKKLQLMPIIQFGIGYKF